MAPAVFFDEDRGAYMMPLSQYPRRSNFALEPTAAVPSVCGCAGRFAAPGLCRRSVSGGYGSALCEADFVPQDALKAQ
jgi:hypothetical protein